MRDKKFNRFEPDERKDLLVRSVIRCLRSDGYAGLSVRKIAREASVSQGLVNHHFGSIDSLIIHTYHVLSSEFFQSTKELIDTCTGSAVSKLDIYFREHFSEESIDPELLKVWLVFWSLVRNSKVMESTYEHINNETEQLLGKLLQEISKEESLGIADISLAAQHLMALLDGLWVRASLSAHCLPPENTLKILKNWVKGYRSGLFS